MYVEDSGKYTGPGEGVIPPDFALLALARSSVPKPKEGELFRCEFACLPSIDLLTCAIGVPIGRHPVAPPALAGDLGGVREVPLLKQTVSYFRNFFPLPRQLCNDLKDRTMP